MEDADTIENEYKLNRGCYIMFQNCPLLLLNSGLGRVPQYVKDDIVSHMECMSLESRTETDPDPDQGDADIDIESKTTDIVDTKS